MMGFPEDWIDLDERVAKKEKLRGIGNAVVPQVAEVLGRAILKTFGEGEK
jgi:site-specific DNA-cytosine methylase